MNTLKHAQTPAAKLYNWNIMSQALELVGIILDPDTKSLIIAGDREMLIEVLSQIYTEETGKKFVNASNSSLKPLTNHEGGVMIESINETKELVDAGSCLEYLILSFCRNFSLRPKQGAGLLAQGCKFLAHIVAKGLKGDFEPIKIWLQEIYGSSEKLTELIMAERNSGSLNFVMSALKPGILSKDLEVVQWTFRVISRLALDFSFQNLLQDAWSWFLSESVIDLCIASLRRTGKEAYSTASEMLMQLCQGNYIDLFTLRFPNSLLDPKEHVEVLAEFLEHLVQSQSTYEEIAQIEIVSYWINLALQEIESDSNVESRASAINLLMRVVEYFFSTIGNNENIMNSILNLINRTCRDESIYMKTIAVVYMFHLLQLLAAKKSQFAPIVYRTLTFLLVENYTNAEMRDFLERNFTLIFKSNANIPVGILLEPLVKRLQVSEISLEIFDYDFMITLAEYPNLSVKHGIQLIDIVGKLYLNDFIYSKAAGVCYTYLASRFIEHHTMHEYLFMFIRYSLNLVLATEQKSANPSIKKGKKDLNTPEQIQQRNRILDMVSWIIQQWQDGLNAKIKEFLMQTNYAFLQVAKKNCKSILVVLELFGSAEDLLKEFKASNPKLFEAEKIIEEEEEAPKEKEPRNEDRQLAIIKGSGSKGSLAKKKPYFPWERAAGDIEKAKKRKQDKDEKIRDEELKQQQKLLNKKRKIKKQLEFRKLEQGVGKESSATLVYEDGEAQKLIAPPDEVQLRQFTEAENDLQEVVKLLLSKYSRVFKVLFNKYSGTGFKLKVHHKSDFDLHAERKSKITDGEYIKVMKDHNVIPELITKEELRTIMRAYNHRIVKQAEQSYVDYEGFKGVFCQLAYFIYSRQPHDYSHLPPVVSLKLLLDFMRNFLRGSNISTEIFDEADPGTGDKDVVRSLNKLLAKDPNTPMPEGYKRVMDRDLKIIYGLPQLLAIPESFQYAIETLDSILGRIGIRIIEPQIEYTTMYRAKGVSHKTLSNNKSWRRSNKIIDNPVITEEPSKEKIKSALSMISTSAVKLSPALKFCIAHAPSEDKEIYQECADLLEDILHSVQLKMVRVINRQPKGGAQEEKFEKKKEKEKKEEEMKKAEEDKKRKIRQQQLLEELNKAKDLRQIKLQQDEERRKQEKLIEEQRKKENEEKQRRDKEEKVKILKEWGQRKEEESKKQKEDEENKKNLDTEEAKRFEESKKRNQERLEQMIKEKAQKNKETKTDEEKRLKVSKKDKEKKKLLGLKHLKEKDEIKEKKKDIAVIVDTPGINELLSLYNPQIDCVFTFYLSQSGKEMPVDTSLTWAVFDKLSSQLGVYPIVSQDQNLSIFNQLTKRKATKSLSFEEFKNSLILISSKCALAADGDTAKAFEQLIKKIELDLPLKTLHAKLKGLPDITKRKAEEKKNTPIIVNLEKVIPERKETAQKLVKENEIKATKEPPAIHFESLEKKEGIANEADISQFSEAFEAGLLKDINSGISSIFGDDD